MSIIALFVALMVSGLAVAFLHDGLAFRQVGARLDSNLRALEAAESGVAWAEQELACGQDPGGDGVGNLTGTLGGGAFVVTATKDPAAPDRWTLAARGSHGLSVRRIEVSVRRIAGGPWNYAVFAKDKLTVSGGGATDAYDSRLGPYAAQAIHSDSHGTYAVAEGHIGSNALIDISSSWIRGDSNAGPGYTTKLSGGATVMGENTPLAEPMDLPATPYADFQKAYSTNDNGSWVVTGGYSYDAPKRELSVSGGNTITLTGKTYFFSNLTLSGGSKLRITSGPVKIYLTGDASLSGGGIVNLTGKPSSLQFYVHPYALPAGFFNSFPAVTISGGTNTALAVYGPQSKVTMSGTSPLYGAIVCREYTSSGSSIVHHDLALRDELGGGKARIERLCWREPLPPLR